MKISHVTRTRTLEWHWSWKLALNYLVLSQMLYLDAFWTWYVSLLLLSMLCLSLIILKSSMGACHYRRGSVGNDPDFLLWVKAPGEYKCAWHLRERLGLVVLLGRRRCGVVIDPGHCVVFCDCGGGGMGFIFVEFWLDSFVFSNFVSSKNGYHEPKTSRTKAKSHHFQKRYG